MEWVEIQSKDVKAPNVQLMMNARGINHAWVTNVTIRVRDHVEWELRVKLKIIILFVRVKMDLLEIHSTVAIK